MSYQDTVAFLATGQKIREKIDEILTFENKPVTTSNLLKIVEIQCDIIILLLGRTQILLGEVKKKVEK